VRFGREGSAMSMKIRPEAHVPLRGSVPTATMWLDASALTTLWVCPTGRFEKREMSLVGLKTLVVFESRF
jgi:hypothetical protein